MSDNPLEKLEEVLTDARNWIDEMQGLREQMDAATKDIEKLNDQLASARDTIETLEEERDDLREMFNVALRVLADADVTEHDLECVKNQIDPIRSLRRQRGETA